MQALQQSKAGTYEGTGAAQSITLGFKPQMLIIINVEDGDSVFFHIQGMDAATGVSIGAAAASVASQAVTLTATGFSLGTDASVNESAKTFRYFAA